MLVARFAFVHQFQWLDSVQPVYCQGFYKLFCPFVKWDGIVLVCVGKAGVVGVC